MPTFAEIMAAATLREETVEVCVDGALNSTFESLERELRKAERDYKPTALDSEDPRRELAEKIEAVRQQMVEHTFAFTFRGLAAKEWSDLLAAHPGREGISEAWNQLTMPSALVSACSVDPQLSEEEATSLFQVLNEGQRNLLFAAAWAANHGGDVPFSRAASDILAN